MGREREKEELEWGNGGKYRTRERQKKGGGMDGEKKWEGEEIGR